MTTSQKLSAMEMANVTMMMEPAAALMRSLVMHVKVNYAYK